MTPSQSIDKIIARTSDWRGEKMAQVRAIIRETVPDVTEELKWMGTPTWSHNGILCICNPFKDFVKVTFMNGAQLKDTDGVFNAELEGNKWRAIKIFEGDKVKTAGLKKLLLAAVALNADKKIKSKTKAVKAPAAKARTAKARTAKAKASPAEKKPKATKAAAKPKRAAASASKAKK